MKKPLSKNIKKPKKTLSKVKKKYKKPIKKILDMVVKEYKDSLSDKESLSDKDSLSDSFIDKKFPKTHKLKIPKSKISCDDFIDKKTTEKIITQELKIPETNIFEVCILCFGNLYNKVFSYE
jgi:hypothetical protein